MKVTDSKTLNILNEIIDKYYDIEVFKNTYEINLNPNDYKDSKIEKYNHVLLVNINGLGIGQVHFITDDGRYLLLPWGHILIMKPSIEKEQNKDKVMWGNMTFMVIRGEKNRRKRNH